MSSIEDYVGKGEMAVNSRGAKIPIYIGSKDGTQEAIDMITPTKLSQKNIAGCNGIKRDGDSISGLIRFDLDMPVGPDSGIILEFPNRRQVDVAIQRLQELRESWDVAERHEPQYEPVLTKIERDDQVRTVQIFEAREKQ